MCNYRNRYGEIDIIAKLGDVLVFCEVKYRSSNSCGEPSEAVSESKQKKICRAAFLYYAQNGFANEAPCRFDVLAVYGNGYIVHYTNAFEFRA